MATVRRAINGAVGGFPVDSLALPAHHNKYSNRIYPLGGRVKLGVPGKWAGRYLYMYRTNSTHLDILVKLK